MPEGIIHLNKGVTSIENILDGGVKITFQDDTETTADLVVGADGIRSVRTYLDFLANVTSI